MLTEADLSARLRDEPGADAPPVDTAAVLRGIRRRRLPRLIATGAAVSLAVVGVGVGGIGGVTSLTGSGAITSSTESGVESYGDQGATVPGKGGVDTEDAGQGEGSGAIDPGAAPADGISRAPAEKLNPCGGPLAEVAPSARGLVLTTEFPESAPATGGVITGTVRMTNTSDATVRGLTAAAPATTLSTEGTTLWHSNGPMIASAMIIDLAPGGSLEYPATITAVRCAPEDEAAQQFRDDLPPLAAGTYEISAAIDFAPAAGTGEPPVIELVTGPREAITLR